MIKSEEKLLFVEYFIQYGYFIQTYYMPATLTKTSPSRRILTFQSSKRLFERRDGLLISGFLRLTNFLRKRETMQKKL